MKTCPECGNRYAPHITSCPNDGTTLGPAKSTSGPAKPPSGSATPPSAAAKPPSGPPPRSSRPTTPDAATASAQAATSSSSDSTAMAAASPPRTWIVVLALSVAMVVATIYAREKILGAGSEEESPVAEDDVVKGKKKKKRRGKRKKRRRANGNGLSAESDEPMGGEWGDDDVVIGDIFSEPDDEEEFIEEEAEPEPKVVVTKEMWDPSPGYRSRSQWKASFWSGDGAEVLDFSKPGSDGDALDEAQVQRVLNERRLEPCYREIVQHVPQMRGRVDLSVTVESDGRVSRVVVDRSKLHSRRVEDCIVSKVKRLRFPASTGRATKFKTHFNFSSS